MINPEHYKKPHQYTIGFTAGAFDLLHAGHMLVFKQAKEEACDYLIVGLHRNPQLDRASKNEPVMSVEERRILLEGCRYIDEIWEYDREAELYDYLERNAKINGGRIGVRIVGEDYVGKDFTGKDIGIDIFYNDRKHDYSTTNLRKRTFEAERQKLQLVPAAA